MSDYEEELEQHADAILDAAESRGTLFARMQITRRSADGEIVVFLTVALGLDVVWMSDLSPCEQDLLGLLACITHRLTANAIHTELERRHKVHGLSTVKRSLVHLVELKLLSSSRCAPRGYMITDRGRLTLTKESSSADPADT